jgi:hypothetical protein
MRFIKLLFVAIVAIVGIMVIMINILKFISAIRNTKSRFYREVNKVRLRSQELSKGLVPLTSEDISELSYQMIPNKRIKGLKSKTITTIYNEPLLAFTANIDKHTGEGYAVYYSHLKEFSFIHLQDTIEVFIDELPFGRIKKDGSLRDANNRVIGYLSIEAGVKEIITPSRKLALFNKHSAATVLERMYYLKGELSQDEAEILLALSLPEITKNFHYA